LRGPIATHPKTFLTPQQYLEIERKAEFKSEYYRGEMFAMSGAREAHNLIAFNLATGAHLALADLYEKVDLPAPPAA
jgi:Uma2 family endonuclease